MLQHGEKCGGITMVFHMINTRLIFLLRMMHTWFDLNGSDNEQDPQPIMYPMMFCIHHSQHIDNWNNFSMFLGYYTHTHTSVYTYIYIWQNMAVQLHQKQPWNNSTTRRVATTDFMIIRWVTTICFQSSELEWARWTHATRSNLPRETIAVPDTAHLAWERNCCNL